MSNVLRRNLFREILHGTIAKVIAAVLAILGTAATIRELVLPESTQAKLNFFRIWSLDWPWWLWMLVLLTAALTVLFEGAYRAIRKLEEELLAVTTAAASPDVRLEGTFPGTFLLHAHGHACEIRTGPIIIDQAVLSIERRGEQITRTVYPRTTLQFPIVSDLRNGSKEVELALLYDESRWPEPGTAAAMTEFIRALQLVRRYQAARSVLGRDDVDRDFSALSIAELESIGDRMRQPTQIAFDITYWNSERTRQWRRSELLVYEPERETAFIRHSGSPMSITDGELA